MVPTGLLVMASNLANQAAQGERPKCPDPELSPPQNPLQKTKKILKIPQNTLFQFF